LRYIGHWTAVLLVRVCLTDVAGKFSSSDDMSFTFIHHYVPVIGLNSRVESLFWLQIHWVNPWS